MVFNKKAFTSPCLSRLYNIIQSRRCTGYKKLVFYNTQDNVRVLHLQASFSNFLSRVINRGLHFFSSIFYEVFGGTGLILPEAPRKLSIFTTKSIQKICQKMLFLVPETSFTEFLFLIMIFHSQKTYLKTIKV